jgi:hypothetical protein
MDIRPPSPHKAAPTLGAHLIDAAGERQQGSAGERCCRAKRRHDADAQLPRMPPPRLALGSSRAAGLPASRGVASINHKDGAPKQREARQGGIRKVPRLRHAGLFEALCAGCRRKIAFRPAVRMPATAATAAGRIVDFRHQRWKVTAWATIGGRHGNGLLATNHVPAVMMALTWQDGAPVCDRGMTSAPKSDNRSRGNARHAHRGRHCRRCAPAPQASEHRRAKASAKAVSLRQVVCDLEDVRLSHGWRSGEAADDLFAGRGDAFLGPSEIE